MSPDHILIRNCHGQPELEACVALQIETWGYDPTDVIPRKAFLVWQKVGGQVIGAFDTALPGAHPHGDPASLVGYVNSLPGLKTSPHGEPRGYLHSHMMAVKEDYRNRGLGARLKFAQRQEALSRNIRHMEWTFDPLEIKNAFLNIRKLGAISRTYLTDFYGVSSSRLQGGLPTDRLVAEWHLASSHVKSVLAGSHPASRAQDSAVSPPALEDRIVVPASIYRWKASEDQRHLALELQIENRKRFQQAFAQGLAVIGFDRDTEGNGTYLLGDAGPLEWK